KLKSTWLTEISVYQGQLSVVGETRDPKQVPVLIQQLESLEGISDRRFARVEIMYDKDRDLHVFSIQSIDFVAPDSGAGAN
ncbi:MAG: PilN domain-containing protein, partial [Gammaproteobacteria bacterium]